MRRVGKPNGNDNTTPMPAAEYDEKINKTIPAEPEQDENGLYMNLTIPKRIIGAPANVCNLFEKCKVLAVMSNGKTGAPCGACRELMVQLMPTTYKDIEIMLDYEQDKVMTFGELTPEWWIGIGKNKYDPGDTAYIVENNE